MKRMYYILYSFHSNINVESSLEEFQLIENTENLQ